MDPNPPQPVDPTPSIQVQPPPEPDDTTQIIEVAAQNKQPEQIQKIREIDDFGVEKDQIIIFLAVAVVGSSCLTLAVVLVIRHYRKKTKRKKIEKSEVQ